MKALNFIAFCAWMIGFAGTTDPSGEFQPVALVIAVTGLTVNALTTMAGIRRKRKWKERKTGWLEQY